MFVQFISKKTGHFENRFGGSNFASACEVTTTECLMFQVKNTLLSYLPLVLIQ